MRKYLTIVRSQFMSTMTFRLHFFLTLAGNLLFIILTYFVWKAIFAGKQVMNGMTFNQTFLYLGLATSIFCLFNTWTEWRMSEDIISGNIIMTLIKPMSFMMNSMSFSIGIMLTNFGIVTIPSILLMVFVFKVHFVASLNLLLVLPAILLSFFINFAVNYIVGVISFYTESIWGISITKEMIVTFFSGAMIPLSFFPAFLRDIAMVLPFQAMYNIPLSMITSPNLSFTNCLGMLGVQLFWVLVMITVGLIFYRIAVRRITVNGG